MPGLGLTGQKWENFYDLTKTEKPEIVLHHPHTTDSPRIWAAAWNELVRTSASIKRYISAGRYFSFEGVRSPLEKVLEKTKLGETINFIVYP
jgi:hypothetical protein